MAKRPVAFYDPQSVEIVYGWEMIEKEQHDRIVEALQRLGVDRVLVGVVDHHPKAADALEELISLAELGAAAMPRDDGLRVLSRTLESDGPIKASGTSGAGGTSGGAGGHGDGAVRIPKTGLYRGDGTPL